MCRGFTLLLHSAKLTHVDSFFDTLLPEPVQPEPPVTTRARPLTAADVREQMVAIIAALREADAQPFAPEVFNKHKAMFPIMAQWLDPADGDALVGEFEAELIRFA